jgi:hypothetical protein
VAALAATYSTIPPTTGTVIADSSLPAAIPRYQYPTVQVQPSTFPTPLSETCPTCVVMGGQSASQRLLLVPARGQVLLSPMLVVALAGGARHAVMLGQSPLLVGSSYVFSLPSNWVVQSAYLTGFEAPGRSITEQLFVAQ